MQYFQMEDKAWGQLAALDFRQALNLHLKGLKLIVMKPSTYDELVMLAKAASKPDPKQCNT